MSNLDMFLVGFGGVMLLAVVQGVIWILAWHVLRRMRREKGIR